MTLGDTALSTFACLAQRQGWDLGGHTVPGGRGKGGGAGPLLGCPGLHIRYVARAHYRTIAAVSRPQTMRVTQLDGGCLSPGSLPPFRSDPLLCKVQYINCKHDVTAYMTAHGTGTRGWLCTTAWGKYGITGRLYLRGCTRIGRVSCFGLRNFFAPSVGAPPVVAPAMNSRNYFTNHYATRHKGHPARPEVCLGVPTRAAPGPQQRSSRTDAVEQGGHCSRGAP